VYLFHHINTYNFNCNCNFKLNSPQLKQPTLTYTHTNLNMTGTVEKIKAKVDNALHKDKTHNDPTGPHHSHAANQVDPRVDNTTGHSTTGGLTGSHGTGGVTGSHNTSGLTGSHNTGGLSGTHGTGYSDPTGPHDSRLANKADPRVDSDRIGAQGNTSGAGGYGTGQYGEGHHNTGGLTGHSTTGHNTHSATGGLTGAHGTTGHSDPTGPHDSRLANKLDPRVDSDRIGAQGNTSGAGGYGTGQYGESHTTGHTTGHTSGGLAGGLTGSHGHSDPTGPHDSRLANKVDPRVDSDRYGAQGNTAGAGGYGTGQYGSTTGQHSTGHHTTGGLGGSTVGSGTAPKTAGPHNSDLLNKVDPRVDSDLDGSKTYGGNVTHQ